MDAQAAWEETQEPTALEGIDEHGVEEPPELPPEESRTRHAQQLPLRLAICPSMGYVMYGAGEARGD